MARRKHAPTILGGVAKGKKPPPRARPFPELIDEEDWEVKEGRYPSFIRRSRDPNKDHVMQVPLGETAIDRKIRLHEQAHVTWPADEEHEGLEYVSGETINAVEDARIIELMGRASPEWKKLNEEQVALLTPAMQTAMEGDFQRLSRFLKEGPPKAVKGKPAPKPEKVMQLVEAAQLIASTRGYAEGEILNQIADSADLSWIRTEVEKMHRQHISSKDDPTFDDTVEYAERLEQFFDDKQREIEEMHELMAEAETGSMLERYAADASKPIPKVYTPPTIEKGKEKKAPMGVIESGRVPKRREDGGRQWGKLTIVHKPLVDKLAAREGRRARPTDLGAVPRYMHRLVADQRVFSRRRKKKEFEGTVLIDTSGSMALTPEEVDEILRRWPAVTVGTYSGRGTSGELWIIAKNGRRAGKNDLKPAFGGNVVDGPCLDWLIKQKPPRVWISDGGVTGAATDGYESTGMAFVVDAARKMKQGNIKRLANVQALIRGQATEEAYNGL